MNSCKVRLRRGYIQIKQQLFEKVCLDFSMPGAKLELKATADNLECNSHSLFSRTFFVPQYRSLLGSP